MGRPKGSKNKKTIEKEKALLASQQNTLGTSMDKYLTTGDAKAIVLKDVEALSETLDRLSTETTGE